MLAAMTCGRNSIGYEIDHKFAELSRKRFAEESSKLFRTSHVRFVSVN